MQNTLEKNYSPAVETIHTADYSLITPDRNGKVQARNLYLYLQLAPATISRWFKMNIENNDFAVEGQDYWGFNTVLSGNEVKDFDLLPELAEELCMLARNKKGKEARLFYIACRKKAQKVENQPVQKSKLDLLKESNQNLTLAIEELEKQNIIIAQREKTIEAQNLHNAKLLELKATETKTGLLAIKNDIGAEINIFVNRAFEYIADYRQRHLVARNQYYYDTGKHYLGAKATSLESKKDYLLWLKSKVPSNAFLQLN